MVINRLGSFDKTFKQVSCTKTLRDRFSGLSVLKHFLFIDKTSTVLERSFKITTKLKHELTTGIEMETGRT